MPIGRWRQFKDVAEWRLGMKAADGQDDVDWDAEGG